MRVCSKEDMRLCPSGHAALSSHAERPTHLHRHLMTPACKSVCESVAVDECLCAAAGRVCVCVCLCEAALLKD